MTASKTSEPAILRELERIEEHIRKHTPQVSKYLCCITGLHQIYDKRRQLNIDCIKNIRTGNSEGTRANRRTHQKAYLHFCKEYVFEPYHTNDWRLVQFAQFLFAEDKTPDTVANYVSSVRVLHRLADIGCPPASQIHFTMLMNGLKCRNKHPTKQAEPMDHTTLKLLFNYVDVSDELEAVAWTAVLTGYYLVLRDSNLGPISRNKFDPEKNLTRADFQIRKGIPSIGLRWAKNNQYKNRVNWAPLIPVSDRTICANWWLHRTCRLIPAEESEPLFLVHEKNDRLALSAGQIRRLLKKWCIAASINPKSYTPHCLHRGDLNWAHNAELTQESLKVLGDWSRQAYQRYLDIGFEARVKSGKKMKQFIDGNVSTSLQAPEKKMWQQFREKHN